MSDIILKEIKVAVAKRHPPGDKWKPFDNNTLILDSLTECLEHIYQTSGKTQFYMDAREGIIYTIDTEETKKEVVPEKQWSLYGE